MAHHARQLASALLLRVPHLGAASQPAAFASASFPAALTRGLCSGATRLQEHRQGWPIVCGCLRMRMLPRASVPLIPALCTSDAGFTLLVRSLLHSNDARCGNSTASSWPLLGAIASAAAAAGLTSASADAPVAPPAVPVRWACYANGSKIPTTATAQLAPFCLAHHGRVTQGPCSGIDPHTDLRPLHAHLQNSGSSDADYVRPAAKGLPKEITLYQYEVCPFCCKVKAALDFYKVGERCAHPAATVHACLFLLF